MPARTQTLTASTQPRPQLWSLPDILVVAIHSSRVHTHFETERLTDLTEIRLSICLSPLSVYLSVCLSVFSLPISMRRRDRQTDGLYFFSSYCVGAVWSTQRALSMFVDPNISIGIVSFSELLTAFSRLEIYVLV